MARAAGGGWGYRVTMCRLRTATPPAGEALVWGHAAQVAHCYTARASPQNACLMCLPLHQNFTSKPYIHLHIVQHAIHTTHGAWVLTQTAGHCLPIVQGCRTVVGCVVTGLTVQVNYCTHSTANSLSSIIHRLFVTTATKAGQREVSAIPACLL